MDTCNFAISLWLKPKTDRQQSQEVMVRGPSCGTVPGPQAGVTSVTSVLPPGPGPPAPRARLADVDVPGAPPCDLWNPAGLLAGSGGCRLLLCTHVGPPRPPCVSDAGQMPCLPGHEGRVSRVRVINAVSAPSRWCQRTGASRPPSFWWCGSPHSRLP